MKRRILATTLVMAMIIVNILSINFMTASADTVIFSDDFAGGKTSYEYTLYDDTVAAEVKATSSGKNDAGEYDVESLEYKGEEYNGDPNGGWKVDITSFVTSGMKLGLSFDYMMDYYDGKVFIEVRSASGAVVNTYDFTDAPKTTEAWKSYTSAAQPTISFAAGQKVYLCVMQESGFWFVSNIELSSIGGGSTGGDTTGGNTTSGVVFSDDFSGGKTDYDYTLYDTSVAAEVKATSSGKNDAGEYDVESLEYKGEEYNGDPNGGWKVDITSFVTSGMKLGLSFDYMMDYYDGKVFIEVRSASGAVVNTYDFTDAPKTTEAWKSYTSAAQPAITFAAGQTVYLCVMQESGFWFVSNIELSAIGGSTGGGGGNGGGNTGSSSAVILNDTFAGGKTSNEYTLYDDADTASLGATAYGQNDSGEYDAECLKYQGVDYEGSATGGWKIDITDKVTNGTKLGLSFDYMMNYYDGKAFIEVRSASGSVVDTFAFSDAPKTSDKWASYTSTTQPTISFAAGQTVYLCVMQESGYWMVSNLKLSTIGGSTGGGGGQGSVTSGVIFSDDFSGGKTDYDYTLYDTSVAAEVTATSSGKNDAGEYDVESLEYKGEEYNGDPNGGWKVDITSFVTSGMKLGLSFDYMMDYYDGKVFIEVRSASGAVVNTYDFTDAPKTTEAWKSYTSAAQPTITFSAGQTVYLCVKQESGFWFVSNIELSSIGGGGSVTPTPSTKTVFSDDFSGGKTINDYTLYDTSVLAEVTATSSGKNDAGEYDVESLQYKGEEYNGDVNGGWKVDITSKVSSGMKLGLSFDYMMDYYDGKVFIEVRNAAGTAVSKFDFSDAPKTTEAWKSYTSAAQPAITFAAGQKVYLCVMQESGFWFVSNIKLTSIGGSSVDPTPVVKEWVTIINETYDGGVSKYNYSLYDTAVDAEVGATAYGPDSTDENYDVECLEFKGTDYAGDDNGGWKLDITSLVANGDKVKASFDYKADYYNMEAFIEVRNAAGTAVKTFDLGAPELSTTWTSFASSPVTVSYADGQSVYLCVKHKSGYWHIDNLKLMKEEAASAIVITNVVTVKGTTTVIPTLETGTIKTTVTLGNLSTIGKTAYVITGVYDGNKLITLSPVSEVTVNAGKTNDAITRVTVDNANYVVKTFVWDLENDMMNEFTKPVTFDKSGLSYDKAQIQEVDMTSLKGVYNENF